MRAIAYGAPGIEPWNREVYSTKTPGY